MSEKWSNQKIGLKNLKKTHILGPLILIKNHRTCTRVEYPMDPIGFLVQLAALAEPKTHYMGGTVAHGSINRGCLNRKTHSSQYV